MQLERTKRCSKCGEEKVVSNFRNYKNGKYGVHSCCKVCESLEQKEIRAKRLQQKVCQRCGTNKIMPDSRVCEACNNKLIEYRKTKDFKEVAVNKIKMCTICEIEKPLKDFYKSKYTSDGTTSQCKKCEAKRTINTKRNYISKGRCMDCGGVPIKGLQRCTTCRDKGLVLKRKFRETQIEKGLCVCCGESTKSRYKKCKVCLEKNRLSRAKIRTGFSAKVGDYFNNVCAICKWESTDVEAFDCHHVFPELKLFGIAGSDRRDWDAEVLPELSKCAYVCARCHRQYHAGRFEEQIKSGELTLVPGKDGAKYKEKD